MASVVVVVPGSPAVVAQLAPADQPSRRLREAARRTIASYVARGYREIDVVIARREADRTGIVGSFAAWGAPQVTVGGGEFREELIARYLIGAHEDLIVHVGERLEPRDGAITVVVADGPAGLGPRAPLAHIEEGEGYHQRCEQLLSGQPGIWEDDEAARSAGLLDPSPWRALAAWAPKVGFARLVESDSSLGVGRYVAAWELGEQPIRPIAIVGPTASGKSALSIALAKRLGGEIVNVDSMQLYRGMDIGTAKLPEAERAGIPHHQLDVWEITDTASVARYQADAVASVEAIMARGKVPILVGGSMLYVQSLIDAWQFPPTDLEVRRRWEARLGEVGIDALHAELAAIDPAAAAIIEDKDPRRTVRALEVIELTGKPFQASQPPKDAPPRWGSIILGLKTTPEWLNPRIELRTRQMFEQGFVDEVKALVAQGLQRDSTAGRAIGYAQVLEALAGELGMEEMEERTVTQTRRYVRRQRSWFNRDPRIHWLEAAGDTLAQALDVLAAEGVA